MVLLYLWLYIVPNYNAYVQTALIRIFEFLFSEAKGNEPAVQSEETVGKYDNIGVIL